MTTLPPAGTREFNEDTLEKKVYNLVESLSKYIPIMNDRNRLAFCLYKYKTGEGDNPALLVKTTKIRVEGISLEELAQKIESELEKI